MDDPAEPSTSTSTSTSTATVVAGSTYVAEPLSELSVNVEDLEVEELINVALKLSATTARGRISERDTRKVGRVVNRVLRKLNRLIQTERASSISKYERLKKQSSLDRLSEMAVCMHGVARLKESQFHSVPARAVGVQRAEMDGAVVGMLTETNDIADIQEEAASCQDQSESALVGE